MTDQAAPEEEKGKRQVKKERAERLPIERARTRTFVVIRTRSAGGEDSPFLRYGDFHSSAAASSPQPEHSRETAAKDSMPELHSPSVSQISTLLGKRFCVSIYFAD
jgi:hypothetical protein